MGSFDDNMWLQCVECGTWGKNDSREYLRHGETSLIDIDMVGLVCDSCYNRCFWHHDQRDWELWRSERLEEQAWQHSNSVLAGKAGKGSKPTEGSMPTWNGNGGEGKGGSSNNGMNANDNGGGYMPTEKGNGGEGKGGSSDDAMNANDNGGGYMPTEKGNGGKGKGGNRCDAWKGKYNGGGCAPTGKGMVAFAMQGENEGTIVIRSRRPMSNPIPQTQPFDMPPNYYDPATAEALAAQGWQRGPNGWHWPGAAAATADWNRWKRRH